MKKFFNMIISLGLSPNEAYVLLCLKSGEKPQMVNIDETLKVLYQKGMITTLCHITSKGLSVGDKLEKIKRSSKKQLTEEDKTKIEEYRQLFPKGKLPSGYPARVSVKELEKKFEHFFSNYDYDWDIVIKATKKYIQEHEPNYDYMKTSSYFIYKSGLDKTLVSTLSSYCDMILESDDDDNQSITFSRAL
jgi:hypothetical protein